MITLAIDTSTPQGSVALLDGDQLRLDESITSDRSHSSALFVTLEKARARIEHLDQIVVGLGPGSYAGVRIAIAAALGLHLSLGARLVGIPSVAALATSALAYLAIGDARRETFYFTRIENGLCVEGPLLATETELTERLQASPDLPLFATAPIPQFPGAQLVLPSAVRLAHLAAASRGITAADTLEPIYLREPYITKPKSRPGLLPRQ
jgi:tRNA threonylcarbamoyladenosine biosynthesis protein TsaB